MISLTKMRELDLKTASDKMRPLHVSAASGLVCIGATIYVVADDELHMGVFSTTGAEPGDMIRLFDGELPNVRAERKRRKPDLEALAILPAFSKFPHGALLAMGSGSRPNRCRGTLLGLDANGAITGPPCELDLTPILGPLKNTFPELNIEGAVVFGDELRLFQRGNKRHAHNAIIRYSLSGVLDALQSPGTDTIKPSAVNRLDLGLIRDVSFCFTDATALPNGDMVFCAVAEDTEDSYRDGACIGAGIGIVENDGRLLWFRKLEQPYKVEGISARQNGSCLDLLLVTDADDPSIPAALFFTSIEK